MISIDMDADEKILPQDDTKLLEDSQRAKNRSADAEENKNQLQQSRLSSSSIGMESSSQGDQRSEISELFPYKGPSSRSESVLSLASTKSSDRCSKKRIDELNKETIYMCKIVSTIRHTNENPFRMGPNGDNYYRKLFGSSSFTEYDYQNCLKGADLCLTYIFNNSMEHLKNFVDQIDESSDFRVQLRNSLLQQPDVTGNKIYELLNGVLLDSLRANDLHIFLLALANGADMLYTENNDESIFQKIIQQNDRSFVTESYNYVIRNQLFAKDHAQALVDFAARRKDAKLYNNLSKYMFLPSIRETLPVSVSDYLEIIECARQFVDTYNNINLWYSIPISDEFFDKLIVKNCHLDKEAKCEIIKTIIKSDINVEQQIKRLSPIVIDIEGYFKNVDVMDNNIFWRENAAFEQRFGTYCDKNYFKFNTDDKVKHYVQSLMASAIFHANVEAMKTIRRSAFKRYARTRHEFLDEIENQNEYLIGLDEVMAQNGGHVMGENNLTLLSMAIKCNNKDTIVELLKSGAYLLVKDSFYEKNLTYFEEHPEVLRQHFDGCIKQFEKFRFYPGDAEDVQSRRSYSEKYNKQLILRFENFMLPVGNTESNFSNIFDIVLTVSKGSSCLLEHPLISTLIFLKWNALSNIFLLNFLIVFAFCIFYVLFLLLRLNLISNDESNAPAYNLLTSIVIMYVLFLTVREAFQCYQLRWSYLRYKINWFEISLIVFIALTLPFFDFHREHLKGFASLAVLLNGVELSVVMRSDVFPFLSLYVMIFEQVIQTYMEISIFLMIYIGSFSLSFMILFKTDASLVGIAETTSNATYVRKDDNDGLHFGAFVPTALKTLIMFTGEFDAGSILFNLQYYWGYLIFIIFVCMMSLIALNLLHGLAVSDVQVIIREAELNMLIFKARILPKYEKVVNRLSKLKLFANFFRCFNHPQILTNEDGKIWVSQKTGYLDQKIKHSFVNTDLSIDSSKVVELQDIRNREIKSPSAADSHEVVANMVEEIRISLRQNQISEMKEQMNLILETMSEHKVLQSLQKDIIEIKRVILPIEKIYTDVSKPKVSMKVPPLDVICSEINDIKTRLDPALSEELREDVNEIRKMLKQLVDIKDKKSDSEN